MLYNNKDSFDIINLNKEFCWGIIYGNLAWKGCHKYSEVCKFCYIHKGNLKRSIDTNKIIKSNNFLSPLAKNKKGEYKIKSGQIVYLCFSSDFLIEESDEWRNKCWDIIRERTDLHFIFLTKRIERFMKCIPNDLVQWIRECNCRMYYRKSRQS